MTPPTEQALKRMLAMMLPEKIYYDDEFGFFFWKPDEPVNQNPAEPSKFEVDWLNGVCVDIRDTEWPYIVGLVEGKILHCEVPTPPEDSESTWWELYQAKLNRVVIEDDKKNKKLEFWTPIVHASWPQRAQAMFEIGFLKGE